MNRTRSRAAFDRAGRVSPGGVHSPVRAFRSVGGTPVFFARGEGAHVWDVDGNRYLDLCMSWGPLILGHAHPAVIAAVREAASRGLSFGACHEGESALAEAILKGFPAFERVRFVSSGTEAVMTALRLTRGATGRRLVLKFEGGYHGHSDALLVKAGSGLATLGVATTDGVPADTAATTLVAPFDDDDALTAIFAEHGDDLACVIVEPLPANNGLLPQRPEWLARLRSLCDRHGALLVFDEVITGFRLRYGGAGPLVGVEPDLVTLGKIVGGGMPVGAVTGPATLLDLLAPVGRVYQAGTLSGNPVSMAAGLATLSLLQDGSVHARLEEAGARLARALCDGAPPWIQVQRAGSIVWPTLADGPLPRRADAVAPATVERFGPLHAALLERGFYLPPAALEVLFLSAAHSDEDLDAFARAYRDEGSRLG
jgi:glutamate-1-semialdehyde 2,1-aminomutase